MKFRVTMKDTDSLYDGVNEALDEEMKSSGLPEDEQEALREIRLEKAQDVAEKWFEYGEYLTVEIDTELAIIKVISNET